MGKSSGSGALPRSYSQWIKEKDGEENVGNDGGESKCAFMVVALCPCLICFILLLIVVSIILIVKFHFLCHTLIFKKNCH